MGMTAKISEMNDSLKEFLNGQEWYQQLRGLWDQLDYQTKTYVRLGAAAAAILLILILVLSSVWKVRGLRSELNEKHDLLSLIQSATNEMAVLKAESSKISGRGGDLKDSTSSTSWSAYFESVAASAGIEKGNITVTEKKADSSDTKATNNSESTQETLATVTLKRINIKQLVQFSYNLENGSRIVKIRNLAVDTKNDPSGYLEATLAVSGLSILPQK